MLRSLACALLIICSSVQCAAARSWLSRNGSLFDRDVAPLDSPLVRETTYAFPIKYDPLIWNFPSWMRGPLSPPFNIPTQLQGSVFYPLLFERTHQHPVVFILPGAHATCRKYLNVEGYGEFPFDYGRVNDRGGCWDGNPIASHDGFRYLGQALANQGYFVVSIDPLMLQERDGRQGDWGNIVPRARLILRTMELLRKWDADAKQSKRDLGVDISGSIDFGQVAFIGHSRGGQAARYAYNILTTPDALSPSERRSWKPRLQAQVVAILEVAPTDFMLYGKKIDAVGVPWLLLGAGCEDDITSYQFFQTAQRQSRVNTRPNYSVTVFGANHFYFNSEWPDLSGDYCLGDQQNTWDTLAPSFGLPNQQRPETPLVVNSSSQQDTLTWAAETFFAGHLGRDANLSHASVLKPSSAIEPGSGTTTEVSGVELGLWNPNLANSKVLNPMDVAAGIDVSPSAGPPLSLMDHAIAQWQNLENLVAWWNIPPNVKQQPLKGWVLPTLSSTAVAESGVAVPLSSDLTTTKITLPLGISSAAQNPSGKNRGTCEIHVDVARRNMCYMNIVQNQRGLRAAIQDHEFINMKKACALPKVIDVVLNVGSARSAPLPLKSRFNFVYGQDITTTGYTKLQLLPTAWETIVAPCSEPQSEIYLTLKNADPPPPVQRRRRSAEGAAPSRNQFADEGSEHGLKRRVLPQLDRDEGQENEALIGHEGEESEGLSVDEGEMEEGFLDDDGKSGNNLGTIPEIPGPEVQGGWDRTVKDPSSFLYIGPVRMVYNCGRSSPSLSSRETDDERQDSLNLDGCGLQ